MIIKQIAAFTTEINKRVSFLSHIKVKSFLVKQFTIQANFPFQLNTGSVWILDSGAWDDSGVWDDFNIWID